MIIRSLKRAGGMFFLLAATLFFTSFQTIETTAQELICPPRGITQLTESLVLSRLSEDASINADGRFVAFESNVDFNDNNPNSIRQIYIADTLTKELTQITFDQDYSSVLPSLNADGTRVAFDTKANINGGNSDNQSQIYIFDTTTDTFTQVTDDPDWPSRDASINAAGNRVAFESQSDINGGNGGNNQEIFVFDTDTETYFQITDEAAGTSANPSISADGNLVAFESNAGNPGGPNNIFLTNISDGTTRQITSSTGTTTSAPSISADGNFIAFTSNESLTGQFSDGLPKVFLFDVNAGTLTLITDFPGLSREPSINADGTVIAFRSSANINGENINAIDDIWLFDTRNGVFTLVTSVGDGDSFKPAINADGTRIAFDSRLDNGMNPEGVLQIFVATCLDPETFRNIPTLSEWGLIAMAGVLGIIGLFVIRRRKLTA